MGSYQILYVIALLDLLSQIGLSHVILIGMGKIFKLYMYAL